LEHDGGNGAAKQLPIVDFGLLIENLDASAAATFNRQSTIKNRQSTMAFVRVAYNS
jgi:hypothetical protein